MTKFCTNCGTEIEKGQDKCVVCGKVFNYKKEPISETYKGINSAINPGEKSRVIAVILGIFFGSYGIHNFYLGYKNRGIIQFLLSFFTFLFSLPLIGFFVFIWGITETILILIRVIDKDGYGNSIRP